jgi:16S rRNA (guanine527-N7)-methyltransferase
LKERGRQDWQCQPIEPETRQLRFHVKHPCENSEREMREWAALLSVGLDSMGVEMSMEPVAVAVTYLSGVLEVNRRINLTRVTEAKAAVRLHLLDSLAAALELKAAPPGEALDLGSGGGFPGVPLAIQSGRRFVLLDSVGKKSRAVQEVLDGCSEGILAETVTARAEELAALSPGRFSAVVARAVAALPSLVELAAPLLKSGGHLIVLKGQPSDAELASGLAVAGITGMREVSRRAFSLPGGSETRTILAYAKVGEAKMLLPRRMGLAQHQPLA